MILNFKKQGICIIFFSKIRKVREHVFIDFDQFSLPKYQFILESVNLAVLYSLTVYGNLNC